MHDVAIIGAGVVGASIARELSRYKLSVLWLEKDADVSTGTSKANSGIVHAGYDALPGSLMAKLNVKGNGMFESLSGELDFHYQNIGSLVVAFNDQDLSHLKELMERGRINGVPDLKILTAEELRQMEPNISEHAVAALYAPTAGITCPYEMTIALAENAVMNGVELFLESPVGSIGKQEDGSFVITAGDRQFEAKTVVNAAGLYADAISRMAGAEEYHIKPRKGEYVLLDKRCGGLVNTVVFQVPGPMGKGVLVTPTADGNILIGPNSYDVEKKDDLETNRAGLEQMMVLGRKSVPEIPEREIINSFAGLRAIAGHDFIIQNSSKREGFVNVGGISSPGLTAAPAIGEYVVELLKDSGLSMELNGAFNPVRKGIPRFRDKSTQERACAVQDNPLYGRVVCRCEMVTEAEIVEAIHRPIPATTLDGIKRRVRTGMGRCQGGFCFPRITGIISRELGIPVTEVTKTGNGSYILKKTTRQGEY